MFKHRNVLAVVLIIAFFTIGGCSSTKNQDTAQTNAEKTQVATKTNQDSNVKETQKEKTVEVKAITWAGTQDMLGTGTLANWGYLKDGIPDGHFKITISNTQPVKLSYIMAVNQEFEKICRWAWHRSGSCGIAVLYENGKMLDESENKSNELPLLTVGEHEYDFYMDVKPERAATNQHFTFSAGKQFDFEIEIVKQNGQKEVLKSVANIK